MKVYLLFYDTDNGDREEWSVFYTPIECFAEDHLRKERIKELENAVDEDDEPYNYKFYKADIDVVTS